MSFSSIPYYIDPEPFRHPFHTSHNIRKLVAYSRDIWNFAKEEVRKKPPVQPLDTAFIINMAQNMHHWAGMASKYGISPTLYEHPLDETALNSPEWEQFDGEYSDIYDRKGFLSRFGKDIKLNIERRRINSDDSLYRLYIKYKESLSDRHKFLSYISKYPNVNCHALLAYPGNYPFYSWAAEISKHQVAYITGYPFIAYASGIPYCTSPFGGDLWMDAMRPDSYGEAIALGFLGGRFTIISNPQLGHCRRLGLTRVIHLPFPINDNKYSPGIGKARKEWVDKVGDGIFIFSSVRIDAKYKGQDIEMISVIISLLKKHPELRFVFINWGNDILWFRAQIQESTVANRVLFLNPAGKIRLIDYYRSCDIFIDQFKFGIFAATFLEAAACGKPIVANLSKGLYGALYPDGIPPVEFASSSGEIEDAISRLVTQEGYRKLCAERMRQWLVNTHGADRTMPILSAILQITSRRTPIPSDIISPLAVPLSEEEIEYHSRFTNIWKEKTKSWKKLWRLLTHMST